MNRSVRRLAVALLALTLSLNASAVFASPAVPVGGSGPGEVIRRVIRKTKKLIKNLTPTTNDDLEHYPAPPKP